jgi:hypothetical protein
LRPASAVAWFTVASPKLQTTIASSGQLVCIASFRRRSIAKAIPTARGRWDAMVDVWGMTFSPVWPKTL